MMRKLRNRSTLTVRDTIDMPFARLSFDPQFPFSNFLRGLCAFAVKGQLGKA
jgi:hypothetical protein